MDKKFGGLGGPLDDVLTNVVELGQVDQLADLGDALGSQTSGNGVVGEAGYLVSFSPFFTITTEMTERLRLCSPVRR